MGRSDPYARRLADLRLVLALPVLYTALTIAALVYTMLAWKDRFWGLAGRVH